MSDIATRFQAEVPLHAAASAVVDDLHDAAEGNFRLTDKIRAAERELRGLTTEISSELMSMHGVSSVVAAGLIGHAGDLRNYRNAGAFAAKCGAAPVPCSSGRRVAVRVNRGGDRQLNRLLHVIAVAQVATKAHPRSTLLRAQARRGQDASIGNAVPETAASHSRLLPTLGGPGPPRGR